MRALLRGKMLAGLSRLYLAGAFTGFSDFDDPIGFARLISRLSRIDWVVYAKKPFSRALHVVHYLGRYTHRVAISNSRLVAVTEDAVTFRTKNGALGTLPPVAFLRRFLTHVLPDGLHKIRHYGLYASAHARTALVTARALLGCAASAAQATPPPRDWRTLLLRLTGRNPDHCVRCGAAVDHLPVLRPHSRAPPAAAA
jgi:hypothetical protein